MPYTIQEQRRKNKKWWRKGEKDPSQALFNWLDGIENYQVSRHERNKSNYARYLNKYTVGLRPGETSIHTQLQDDMALNVCHSAVATVQGKIVIHRPRPLFQTQNGKYEDQERAKGLQKFVQGVFSQNDVYTKAGPSCFLDAAVLDVGGIFVGNRHGKIVIERVVGDDIIVDEEAARSARPREMALVRYITKDVLAALYPTHRKAINKAKTIPDASNSLFTDIVKVVEAWHLPSGPNSRDGKRIVALDGTLLDMGKWKRDEFPIARLVWDEKLTGFYGESLVSQLAALQDEINKIIQRIQESMHLLAIDWIVLDKNTKINKAKIKNLPAIILEKQGPGSDPKVVNNRGVHPDVIKYLDYLYQKAFEIAGVSQMSATSRKEPGVESGVAIRTLLDIETQRFGVLQRQWEQLHVTLARMVVAEAQEMKEEGIELEVNYRDKEFIEAIKFQDVDLEDRYTLDVYPTSMLPQTPAGKLSFLQEFIGLGIIKPEQAAMLLEMPDLEKWTDLETAPVRSAHQISEFILAGNDNWVEPQEFMDLQTCAAVGQQYWIQAHIDKVPKQRLDRLGDWLHQVMDMITPPLVPIGAEGQLGAGAPQPGGPAGGNITPIEQALPQPGAAVIPGA